MPPAEQHRKPTIPKGKKVATLKQEEHAATETGGLPRSMSVDEKPLTGDTLIDSVINHHEKSWHYVKQSLKEAQNLQIIIDYTKG